MATALAASRETIRTDWRAAALGADRKNHARLGGGLASYQKAEGRFPSAVAGGALLPPETRLSWIATMLPYYGHGDWYEQLETGYSWNGPQNRSVTKRPLPEAINPALGPAETEAGFPVTHYVGVAGVGEGAGRLKADDPRAGVFGFAVLGYSLRIQGRHSPWLPWLAGTLAVVLLYAFLIFSAGVRQDAAQDSQKSQCLLQPPYSGDYLQSRTVW